MSGGNGDLWPSCWASDGNLYAANGDGTNFNGPFNALAIGKIAGMPLISQEPTWPEMLDTTTLGAPTLTNQPACSAARHLSRV